ncbi:hypothetical protein [Streptomyces sp. NPDC051569]|uniref:hypothetical protein n=1 Tax=Streptomyces sp. NPDC051569 TaxID=3365661 RepID=UPI00379E4AAE
MSDRRMEGPGEHGPVIPRDMPDQQVQPGDDPLDIRPAGRDATDATEDTDTTEETVGTEDGGSDQRIPDPDESGAGRRGSPRRGGVHPEQPVPDEATG